MVFDCLEDNMQFALRASLIWLLMTACDLRAPFTTAYPLTITIEGDGTGLVSSEAGDLECTEATCTVWFAEGDQVQLWAEARSGLFLGWSQACEGPGVCTVAMDGDRSVTAIFGSSGHPRWLRQIGGIGWDRGDGITSDGEGNVIVRWSSLCETTASQSLDLELSLSRVLCPRYWALI